MNTDFTCLYQRTYPSENKHLICLLTNTKHLRNFLIFLRFFSLKKMCRKKIVPNNTYTILQISTPHCHVTTLHPTKRETLLENSLFTSVLWPILHRLWRVIVAYDVESLTSFNIGHLTDVESKTFYIGY